MSTSNLEFSKYENFVVLKISENVGGNLLEVGYFNKVSRENLGKSLIVNEQHHEFENFPGFSKHLIFRRP